MPRIHPIHGVPVLTLPEFLNEEAKREGKEPYEIMNEIFEVMEDDSQKIREDYRTNALKYLQESAKEYLHNWTEDSKSNGEVMEYNRFDFNTQQYVTDRNVYDAGPRPPQPVELIEVIDVKFSQNFRGSQSQIVAKCKADDEKVYKFTLSRGDWAGSFYEPPDSDEDLKWE